VEPIALDVAKAALSARGKNGMMNSSMRPMLVIGSIALAVAVVVGISEWRAAHAKDIIPWRADLAAARQEAAQNHRPVFAYFTAGWCEPCQAMKSTTWADDSVKRAMEKYVPVKIDLDQHRDAAEHYGIEAVPTYLILSGDGEIKRLKTGMMLPEDMVAWLEQ
jgi:thiol:disulfide interchange protein